MRRAVLVLVGVAGLLLAGCGGDDEGSTTTTGAADPTTTTAAVAAPRLTCPGGIRTFQVTGRAIGAEPTAYASADEAAQAEVDRRDNVESHALIGDDPAGTRYALLDATGAVVEEAVFSDERGTWNSVQFDSCAA